MSRQCWQKYEDTDVLVLGDLNSYGMEDAIKVFTDAGYINLLKKYSPAAWSYCYRGEGKPGGEDVNPAPEVVEFVNSNLVYWGDKDGVGTDHFVLTLYTDMEVDATGNPIGPGKIMAFSLNVPPFASEADIA